MLAGKPTHPTFVITYNMGGGVRRPVSLQLLGGYGYGRMAIVIYRDPTGGSGGEPVVGLLELRRNWVLRPVGPRGPALDLAGGDLERFLQMPDHYQFLLNKRWWRKLPIDQLARRVKLSRWHTV